jgi:DNA-binding transcriptional ArsR family regulator
MPSTPAPESPTTIRDVAVMRALAHPARLALMSHLSTEGPATATECASVVDLSPSATSYHLRALAKVGMVEEAPGTGDARERRWRSTVGSYRVEFDADDDAETVRTKHQLLNSFIAWEEAQAREYLARVGKEPQEWQEVAFFNGTTLLMTAEELRDLGESIMRLIDPYRKRTRTDHPAGARTVSSLVRAFPADPPLR